MGTNLYSVPVEWVGHEVEVKTEAESIVILHRNDPPVRHRRRYGRFKTVLELEHYLPLLRRKCRGLDRAVPFRRWVASVDPCWKILLREFRRHRGEVEGSRDFIDVLTLCEQWGLDELTVAVKKTLARPVASLTAVRFFVWRRHEEETPRPPTIDYGGPGVVSKSAEQYECLRSPVGCGHE